MNAARMDSIIEYVTEGIYRDYPALLERFGERGREKCCEDNEQSGTYRRPLSLVTINFLSITLIG